MCSLARRFGSVVVTINDKALQLRIDRNVAEGFPFAYAHVGRAEHNGYKRVSACFTQAHNINQKAASIYSRNE